MKENFDHKEYRDSLAKDLKNVESHDERREMLDSEKGKRYQMAQEEHIEERRIQKEADHVQEAPYEKMEKIIDTTKEPTLPNWARGIEVHDTSQGIILWDKEKNKDTHYDAPDWRITKTMKSGKDLLDYLRENNIPFLNATVLDHLMKHQEEIPDEWKTKGWILFCGTVFNREDDERSIRSLYWHDNQWKSDAQWFSGYLGRHPGQGQG